MDVGPPPSSTYTFEFGLAAYRRLSSLRCQAAAVMGLLRTMSPVEPKNWASPNEKMPPSDATSQYPLPDGVTAMLTIGCASGRAPADPKNSASPNVNIPPSDASSQ